VDIPINAEEENLDEEKRPSDEEKAVERADTPDEPLNAEEENPDEGKRPSDDEKVVERADTPDEPLNAEEENPDEEKRPSDDEKAVEGADTSDEPQRAGPRVEETGADEMRETSAVAAERDEFYNKFLRAKADLENYRKRVQRERENMRDFAVIDITRGLLPVLDDLDRALNAPRDNRHVKHFLKGIKLIEGQLFKVLEEKGVKPIKATGEAFDPNLHEAVMIDTESDQPDNTVIEELQKGYIYKDKVVRPAKVKVAKKS